MNDFNGIINSAKPTLVDFYAEWCGPCKTMAPILKDVKAKLGDGITILKVDVDRNSGTAAAYKVNSVPTLILFKEGRVVWRQAGVVRAAELERLVRQFSGAL